MWDRNIKHQGFVDAANNRDSRWVSHATRWAARPPLASSWRIKPWTQSLWMASC